MTDNAIELPQSVTHIKLDDRDIYLVGTAHVSTESVEDVKKTVELISPDAIAVELCQPRHKAMTNPQAWQQMNIFNVIKQKKSTFLLAQMIMSSFYKKLGKELGIQPGAEMLEGINLAEQTNVKLVLADREIEVTLKRLWGNLTFFNKLKLFYQLLLSFLSNEKIDAEMIETLKAKDQLTQIMEAFGKSLPQVKKYLIDERDIYLAQKIRSATEYKKIVAVVGAGHVPGITEHIKTDHDLAEITSIPPKSIWPKILKWSFPIAIIALVTWGFFKQGPAHSMDNVYIWILVNGVLSALGAALALAHPLTIAASFLAAPLTSLNPMIAAGWVAGLVQAKLKKPTVADLENLPEAISSFSGFWKNPATKILLVVAMANLGSGIGTWIATIWIGSRAI